MILQAFEGMNLDGDEMEWTLLVQRNLKVENVGIRGILDTYRKISHQDCFLRWEKHCKCMNTKIYCKCGGFLRKSWIFIAKKKHIEIPEYFLEY